jgi:adenylate cyclase
MAADEVGTLDCLKRLRAEVIEPKIAQFHGRIVGSAGDSVLVEFASAVNAVQCAVEAQEALADRNANLPLDRRMGFRMGVNLGDVIPEDNTIHGDGVNVASRLEKLAEPGSVCIGRNIYEQVKGKLDYGYSDLGQRRVHNIPEPVHAYSVKASKPVTHSSPSSSTKDLPPLPDKPSIAVLPFTNMSGDSEQEFFSDGITEDIITELSRYKSLFVVARNSSFVFRGRAVDIREVGEALGVRYVLEGSVRKAGDRIRVSAQLINASSGDHLWAERYDGNLIDVFILQDDLSRTIVSTIAGRLEDTEANHLSQRPTKDLSAYEHVLRGQKFLHNYSQEDYARAQECFEMAVSCDPKFARAHASLAVVEAYCWFWDIRPFRLERAVEIGETALALDQHESKCHFALGVAHLFRHAHDKSEYHLTKASALNPNDDLVMVETGRYLMYTSQPRQGADLVRQAMRRNPYHPNWYWNILGRCLHTAGDFREAIEVFERITTPQIWNYVYLAACHAALSHEDKAAEYSTKVMALKPNFSIAEFAKLLPYRDTGDLRDFVEGLRRAGLPG